MNVKAPLFIHLLYKVENYGKFLPLAKPLLLYSNFPVQQNYTVLASSIMGCNDSNKNTKMQVRCIKLWESEGLKVRFANFDCLGLRVFKLFHSYFFTFLLNVLKLLINIVVLELLNC